MAASRLRESSPEPAAGPRAARGLRAALATTVVFGIAFGWLEAAVVVYLRRIYYPGGFGFPLVLAPDSIAVIELAREAATLVMLGAVAFLGARTGWGRFGLFAVAFGVWDLVYYIGLHIALGWPASLGVWDVLFLIPAIWTAPVWAPALVAVLLVACGAFLHHLGESGRLPRPALRHWIAAVAALVAILGAFLANHGVAVRGGVPRTFPALVFVSGVAVAIAAFVDLLRAGFGRR